MPNHCLNSLSIRARTTEDLQLFLDQVKNDKTGERFSFDSLVPCPEELNVRNCSYCLVKAPSAEDSSDLKEAWAYQEKCKEKYGYASWYDWRVANWGTKWDCYDLEVEELFVTEIRFNFSTAWSPPCEWLKKIAPMFPNLKFNLYYKEEGNGFQGTAYAHGKFFTNKCHEFIPEIHSRYEDDDWDKNEQ